MRTPAGRAAGPPTTDHTTRSCPQPDWRSPFNVLSVSVSVAALTAVQPPNAGRGPSCARALRAAPPALTLAARLITHTDGCFLVIGIDNALVHGVLGCGAVGAITGVGNVLPDEAMCLWRLCQSAQEKSDHKAWLLAEELDRRLLPLSVYDADPRLVLHDKHLLTLRGESEYHIQRPVEATLSVAEKSEAQAQAQLTRFQQWWANWPGKDHLTQ